MHHQLPRKVRRAAADINQAVSHETVWGNFTQMTYPGECAWIVKGGADWPPYLDQVEVSVTSTHRDGVVVAGLEEVLQAIERTEREIAAGDNSSQLGNELEALQEVKRVLEAAKAE